MNARVSFDAPAKIGTTPRTQTVAARQTPDDAQHLGAASGFRVDGVGGRVVACTGAYHRPAGTIGHDADLTEGAIERLIGRRVRDGVLITDIVSHLVRDAIYIGQLLWKVSLTTRGFGEQIERAFGALGFALLLLAEQTDSVDNDLALLCLFDQPLQADRAGVVIAIGHNQDYLFVLLGFFLDVLDGHADGFPHRRPATRVNLAERLVKYL